MFYQIDNNAIVCLKFLNLELYSVFVQLCDIKNPNTTFVGWDFVAFLKFYSLYLFKRYILSVSVLLIALLTIVWCATLEALGGSWLLSTTLLTVDVL